MLNEDNALQFAIMLNAGLPPSQAILYFYDDPAEAVDKLRFWMNSRLVKRAMASLMKKSWQEMSLDEKCKFALEQHYSQLAFLLHSEHYGEVNPADKSKLDTARTAIEAKLAGMAGKTDALSQFLEDIRNSKMRVPTPKVLPS
jgi:hypothetical protein